MGGRRVFGEPQHLESFGVNDNGVKGGVRGVRVCVEIHTRARDKAHGTVFPEETEVQEWYHGPSVNHLHPMGFSPPTPTRMPPHHHSLTPRVDHLYSTLSIHTHPLGWQRLQCEDLGMGTLFFPFSCSQAGLN